MRNANPPVIPHSELEEFIEDVFGNILDLRECNRRLLECMYVRQREQGPVIQRIGDVFLEAATEFRLAYPIYIGHLPLAEKRLKDEIDANSDFRLFLEVRSRLVWQLQYLMISVGVLPSICSIPGASPGLKAFPYATLGASAQVSCTPGGHPRRNGGRQSGL